MKSESELKTEFVNALRKDGWYARRLEEKFAVGVPDIMGAIPFGPAFLFEAKRVAGNTYSPSPRQKIDLELWEHNSKSQSSYSPLYRIAGVLGFKNGLCYLGLPRDYVMLDACIAQEPNEKISAFVVRYWNWRLHID